MSLIYRKVPQCRICQHPRGAEIDAEFLAKTSHLKIIDTYAKDFPPDAPLTKAAIFNHYKHVKDAVTEAVAAGLAVAKSNLPATLNPNNQPHSPERQEVFQALVDDEIDEIQTLTKLVKSGIADLERVEPSDLDPEADYEFEKKMVRNSIRKDTASVTMSLAKVKQMAVQSLAEQQRLEKSRVAFRMLDLLRKALEVAPQDVRALIAERLKDGLRKDDELKALLASQQNNDEQVNG